MKKGILLVAVLFAVASLMGAFAYNSATITSDGTLKVSATNDALLALIPGTGVGNKDNTAQVVDGVLQIKLGETGIDKNGFPGLQPNSVYQWDNLVTIWNKSAETLELTVEIPGATSVPGLSLYVNGYDSNGNWFDNVPLYTNGQSHEITLGADTSIPLTVRVELDKDAEIATYSGEILVKATAK